MKEHRLQLRRIPFGAVLWIVVTLPSLSGQTTAAEAQVAAPHVAQQLFEMANRSRTEAGEKPLGWDTGLEEAAQRHCARMAAEIPVLHRYDGESDLATRVAAAGGHFSMVEENLAVGRDAETIHNAWLKSPGHRKNLLSGSVDRVGIAVIASQGLMFAVADYMKAVPALKPAEVEARFAALLRARHIIVSSEVIDARRYCASSESYQGSIPARFTMRWENPDVTRLPAELLAELANGSYRHASIGSCPVQKADREFTSYRVGVLLY